MIDFVKYQLKDVDPKKLLGSTLLDFHNKVNLSTGEMGTYKNAFHNGLEFKIYEPTEKNPVERITIEGSLHKYWNKGSHNFNDFGITEIVEVVNEIETKFGIRPADCILKTLEIGVNIKPPIKTKTILNNCLLHKTDRLKWSFTKDEGNYIQCRHQRHFIKIYDKRTHYKNKGFEIEDEIMRFEIKFSKMHQLNQKGIYSIADLLSYGLHNFTPQLLKQWENVLVYDKDVLKGTKYEQTYSNPNYWLELNYNNFKYHRNNLKKLTSKKPDNIKKKIADLIQNKCEILNSETTQINPLHIRLITVVSTSEKTDQNRRFCKVTKLNISMQKKDSFLLSHTGLRYYLKTDKKIYIEVLQKHLPTKWNDADRETQIKELAHNIRNKHNNQKLKQHRLYNPSQMQLFDAV